MKGFDNALPQIKLITNAESYIQTKFHLGPVDICYFLKIKTVNSQETMLVL